MHKIKQFLSLGGFVISGLLCALAPATSDAAAPKRDWTMMVFINGHNNLDDFGQMNINQMEKIGSTEKLNVVVQWASMGQKTKRLLVQKDNDTAKVTSPSVQELPAVDMGDKNSLLDFIKWTHENYPADHYFVVVWNHGSGWHFQGRGLSARDISNDDISGNKITTEELGAVMHQASAHIGRKIDIYGSDACLMGMAEIAQEMAGAVNTFVGSQELEPGAGWPYDGFLTKWVANPGADSNEVGKMLTTAFADYYREEGDSSTTFSTFDMAHMPELLSAMSSLRAKMLSSTNLKSAQDAAKKATRFFYSDYVDLGDAVKQLRTSMISSEALTELNAVNDALAKVVVANGTEMNATGLSIWWPTNASDWKRHSARYKGLKFDQATKWSDALAAMPK